MKNNEVTRALILTAPRSGSEFLVHALDSHPDIMCKSELIKFWEPHEIMERMRNFYIRSINNDTSLVRCHKVFYYYLTPLAWHQIKSQAKAGTLKIIHLIREDHSARVLNWYFNGFSEKRPDKVPAWWYEYKTRQSSDTVSLFKQELKGIPHLELSFEKMSKNEPMERIPVEENKKICKLLGVKHRVLKAKPKRPTDYTKFVTNLDELQR